MGGSSRGVLIAYVGFVQRRALLGELDGNVGGVRGAVRGFCRLSSLLRNEFDLCMRGEEELAAPDAVGVLAQGARAALGAEDLEDDVVSGGAHQPNLLERAVSLADFA